MILLSLFTALLLIEALILSIWLDTAALLRAGGIAPLIAGYGPTTVRAALVFLVLTPVLAFRRRELTHERLRIRWRLLALHAGLLGVFGVISERLFRGDFQTSTVAAWLATGLAAFCLALLAFGTLSAWVDMLRHIGGLVALSAAVAVVSAFGGGVLWQAWGRLGQVTFALVALLLAPVVPGLQTDSASMTISSPSFAVAIAPQCSGYEGMGLVAIFGAAWLWLNRRDYRFPHALLLLPAGVGAMFALNSVRIAALFLIGHLGASEVAAGGFHSQAGWIAFLLVSISFAAISTRLGFVTGGPAGVAGRVAAPAAPEWTTVALAPLLAMVAASVVTGALGTGASIDWLYPLRPAAVVAVLWLFRAEYAQLNWTLSLRPVVSGALVFLIWIAFDAGSTTSRVAAPPVWWVAVRVLSAVLLVPVAEELAFRFFLQRRITAEAFTAVDPRRSTMAGLLGASILFGLLHGQQWIAGVIAGLVFGLEYRRRGSVGDAALSHGVANLLLAVYVLATNSWHLW